MTVMLHINEARLVALVMRAAGLKVLKVPLEEVARMAEGGNHDVLHWTEDAMRDYLVFKLVKSSEVIDGEEVDLPLQLTADVGGAA